MGRIGRKIEGGKRAEVVEEAKGKKLLKVLCEL
jgi:hypothetical protein